MRRLILFFFPALLLAVGVQNAQAQVDVTGTWEISWETPRGATTSTFIFQQDGDTFTGTAQMAMGGRGGGAGEGTRELEVGDGKVEGAQVTFSLAMGRGERSFTFTFTGTVEGDAMEGTMTTMRGENPFTGKRKE